jgi:aminoglycoside phosphotransferase (APT) family kinase protein
MDPTMLLVEALGIRHNEIVDIKTNTPPSLNSVWRFKLIGMDYGLFLKLQGENEFSTSVLDESETLRTLQGRLPHIPRLLSYGVHKGSGRAFIVTEEIAGINLYESINQGLKESDLRAILDDVVSWSSQLQRVPELRSILQRRSKKYISVYSPNFNPIEYSVSLLGTMEKNHSTLFPLFSQCLSIVSSDQPATEPEVIHGAPTVYNLMVSTTHLHNSLVGVLDFEATRLGDPMFDIALMLLYLLMSPRPDFAYVCFERCSEAYTRGRMLSKTIPFFIYLCLARFQAQSRQQTIELPEDDRIHAFLKHVI